MIEFRILNYFFQNKPDVFSRNQIIEAAWGHGIAILERTVDRHISSLRKKLTGSGVGIEPVRGMGYQMTMEYDERKEKI